MSQPNLKDRVAVVTGASLGIGRATAVALGRAGARVVINYRSHREEAEKVAEEVRAAGSEAMIHQADVSDFAAVEGLVAAAVEQFGRVDIAVSNAAYSDREPFYEADLEGFRRTVDVTMWGAFHLLRAATCQMIAQRKEGWEDDSMITLVSSPHAFLAIPRAMAYNMAKAALEQMAKTAAIETAPFRIRVNMIQPGWIDTPGERKFFSEETLQQAGSSIPLGRLGTPEEIAEGIVLLCDPRHRYMTGANLLLDGGISLPWWAEDR